jgi:hypothetical protein
MCFADSSKQIDSIAEIMSIRRNYAAALSVTHPARPRQLFPTSALIIRTPCGSARPRGTPTLHVRTTYSPHAQPPRSTRAEGSLARSWPPPHPSPLALKRTPQRGTASQDGQCAEDHESFNREASVCCVWVTLVRTVSPRLIIFSPKTQTLRYFTRRLGLLRQIPSNCRQYWSL